MKEKQPRICDCLKPLMRTRLNDDWGWICSDGCGAFAPDVKPPTTEEPTDDSLRPVAVKVGGYGCTIAIGMILVFLGWCAYLAHLETMARFTARQ